MKIDHRKLLLFILVVSISLVGFLIVAPYGLNAAAMLQPALTVRPTQVFLTDQQEIDSLRKMLSDPKLDAQSRNSIEIKIKMAEDAASQRAKIADIIKKANVTEIPTPPPGGDTIFPKGIFEGDAGTFKPDEVVIQNRWQGVLENGYIIAFAGSLSDNIQQGVVVVRKTSLDRRTTRYEKFMAPGQTGSLKILGEQKLRLTLQTSSGAALIFNIPEMKFE
jgi:hypothetical protein